MKKKKNRNTKTVSAKKTIKGKPAKKKVVKKQIAKRPQKVKSKKNKKSIPVQAKKKLKNKPVAKKTVKKTSKAKTKIVKNKLPGYPHYAAKDDITNLTNRTKKVTFNDSDKESTLNRRKSKSFDELDEKPLLLEVRNKKSRNSKNLTKDDQDLLGSDELNPDLGEDEVLKERVWPVDMAGDDLDIPGAELDDDSEITGGEDEENNNYSIGGDRHDDLDENQGTTE